MTSGNDRRGPGTSPKDTVSPAPPQVQTLEIALNPDARVAPESFATIVLATGNPHKVAEMQALLGGAGAAAGGGSGPRVISLAEAAAARGAGFRLVEPAETGTTFEENAAIKAVSYCRQLGMACLADDSGIEIDALGGPSGKSARPGVISSHYSTDGRETGLSREARDAANNERVLRELAAVPWEQRGARFVCVMVLAVPSKDRAGDEPRICCTVRGTFEGRIGFPAAAAAGVEASRVVPRGTNGFGYDPLFLVAATPYAYTKTGAELAPEEKNRLSHRGAAAAQIVKWMRGQAGAC